MTFSFGEPLIHRATASRCCVAPSVPHERVPVLIAPHECSCSRLSLLDQVDQKILTGKHSGAESLSRPLNRQQHFVARQQLPRVRRDNKALTG